MFGLDGRLNPRLLIVLFVVLSITWITYAFAWPFMNRDERLCEPDRWKLIRSDAQTNAQALNALKLEFAGKQNGIPPRFIKSVSVASNVAKVSLTAASIEYLNRVTDIETVDGRTQFPLIESAEGGWQKAYGDTYRLDPMDVCADTELVDAHGSLLRKARHIIANVP